MKVEFDSDRELIVVDGVKISLQFLLQLVKPDPDKTYRMTRKDNVVILREI